MAGVSQRILEDTARNDEKSFFFAFEKKEDSCSITDDMSRTNLPMETP